MSQVQQQLLFVRKRLFLFYFSTISAKEKFKIYSKGAKTAKGIFFENRSFYRYYSFIILHNTSLSR